MKATLHDIVSGGVGIKANRSYFVKFSSFIYKVLHDNFNQKYPFYIYIM